MSAKQLKRMTVVFHPFHSSTVSLLSVLFFLFCFSLNLRNSDHILIKNLKNFRLLLLSQESGLRVLGGKKIGSWCLLLLLLCFWSSLFLFPCSFSHKFCYSFYYSCTINSGGWRNYYPFSWNFSLNLLAPSYLCFFMVPLTSYPLFW